MGYLRLLFNNPRTIGFGFTNTFFSGLGQTHFIAILSPILMTSLSLSHTEYGSLYSLVTLCSGLVIPFVGPLIDRYDIRFFALFIGLGLTISQCFLFLVPGSIYLVGLGLFGLRFFGQGLCSSLSSISMARYFVEGRGKALSLSQLGYPLYEGLITPLAALTISLISFAHFNLILISCVLLIYVPLCLRLTRPIANFNKISEEKEKKLSSLNHSTGLQKNWNRRQVFSEPTIYFLIPQALMPPMALTGIFFHQAAIGEIKGWSLSLMASGLAFFAIGRVANTFLTGPLVDAYSARKLFPLYQLPLHLGFLSLAFFNGPWTPAVAFSLFGLSVGSGGPIKSAIWAELYGTRHLGSLKSLFATLMVLSTALSPAFFGYIIDSFAEVFTLLIALAMTGLCASLLSFIGLLRFTKKYL